MSTARSTGPGDFIQTNVVGTFTLLEAALRLLARAARRARRDAFRFHHVSTDEVFGSLGPTTALSARPRPTSPNSPYSASKAASDHLVRAWHHTYGLPVVLTNCSNNYGPYHFPEKLIPLMIINALEGKPLAGLRQRRERARLALCRGPRARAAADRASGAGSARPTNVGGNSEKTNLEVVETICALVDELAPTAGSARASS